MRETEEMSNRVAEKWKGSEIKRRWRGRDDERIENGEVEMMSG